MLINVDIICPCDWFNEDPDAEPETCECSHVRDEHDGGGCTVVLDPTT